ncbi:MAG: 4-amino-4-deoxy-L-arabinose transferase-like glycosyltransferase [Planctomycetota bacterium]|jgi:4-amino-4-deoxy-L-arabinose transferase-like glycosyltransferase
MSNDSQAEATNERDELAPESTKQRSKLRWLMMAAALHALCYLLILPPWMGEDEPWHLEYAHYVAAGHMPWGGREVSMADIPKYPPSQAFVVRELGGMGAEEIDETQRSITQSMRDHDFWKRVDWASWGGGVENFDQVSPFFTATHQPPAYYLFTGQILRLLGGRDILREMWIERGLALLAYLAVVLAAYEVGRRVSTDPSIAIVCALLVAWWPMHARQAAVVSNDVLVKVASAWTLVLALDLARLGWTRKRGLMALGLAGIALAIKSTAAGVLVPLSLALLWPGMKSSRMRSTKFRVGALTLILLAMAALVLVLQSSHNPAVPHRLAEFQKRIHEAAQPAFRNEFARTAVGAFNWYSRDLPQWLYNSVGCTLALALIGLLVSLMRRASDLRRGLTLLCLAGCSAQLLLVILRGTAVGRYAIPMLPAFAALAAVGFLAPFPPKWRARVGALIAILLLAFDGYFAWAGLVWNQYGVWGS